MKTLFFLFILIILSVIIIQGGRYFGDEIKILTETLISPYKSLMQKKPVSAVKPAPPPDWRGLSIPLYGLNLVVPADTEVPEGRIIPKTTIPVIIKPYLSNDKITISNNSGVLIPGLYNQDLFRNIYNLKEDDEFSQKSVSAKTKFKKIESGKILTGQPYVVCSMESFSDQANVSEIKAFILQDTTLVIFTLNNSKDENVELLKKIVSFASLDKTSKIGIN